MLDASVLIAIVKDEAYEQSILSVLPSSVISSVNFAEVLTKFSDLGIESTAEVDRVFQFLQSVEPFTVKQAQLASQLRLQTRHAGLSLEDRACLALAIELGVPAYTTDRIWLRVDVGCTVHCLR